MAQMFLAPAQLVPRCQRAFDIVSVDPNASVYQLNEVVEETFQLVETHLSEVDTTQARAGFAEPRQVWEYAPDELG